MTYRYQFYSHTALIFHYLLGSIKPKYSTELYAKWRRQTVRCGCCKTNCGFNPKSAFFFVTEREVAHGPTNDYPHISLRDTQWWVNKRGIFFLFWSTFVFQKIRKSRTRCRPLQKWRTLVPQVWTQELRSWKVQKQGRFSSFCILYLCAKYWHYYLRRHPGFLV